MAMKRGLPNNTGKLSIRSARRLCLRTENILYIHISGHRNRFIFDNRPDSLIVHAGYWWPFPSRVRMELQFHPDSAWKLSSKPALNLSEPSVQ